MSRSSYTASERRGVLVIAILALLIIGFGAGMSVCNRSDEALNSDSSIESFTEMVDSVAAREESHKTVKKKKNKKSSSKTKNKKNYRRRSPLDEPV